MVSRFTRKIESKKLRKVIKIFTEGTKTEPNYFNAIKDELRLNEILVKVVGTGDHTMPLVERVIHDKNNQKDVYLDTEYWVVFDKDDHGQFKESIEKASAEGIHVAYSNTSFELWFVLHFEYLSTALHRSDFYPKLSKMLGVKYDKSNSDIYNLLKDKESVAIRNAKKLEEMHKNQRVTSLDKKDPSTTVYLLVESLRDLKKK